MHDNGYRNFSSSDVRRFYGDIGYKTDTSEFHLNMGAADNHFGAAAASAGRTAAAELGRDLHHAASPGQSRRLFQFDEEGRCYADLDDRRQCASADLQSEHAGRQSDRDAAVYC